MASREEGENVAHNQRLVNPPENQHLPLPSTNVQIGNHLPISQSMPHVGESSPFHNESNVQRNVNSNPVNIQPQTPVQPFIKRHGKFMALVMISLVTISFGLWDVYELPKVCSPEDITSIGEMPNFGPSYGLINIKTKFIQHGDNVQIEFNLKNNGRKLESPVVRIYYYNPLNEYPGDKIVELLYHLKDCKCSLDTGTTIFYLNFPFTPELALDMAIAAKAEIFINIQTNNKVVYSKSIPLPSDLIFGSSWLKILSGRTLRVMIFGEQGSAKTTLINDFLNMLQSIKSKINFVPPPSQIHEKGTIGISKIEIQPPHDSLLDSSIVFYDTEGSQDGKFLLTDDLEQVLLNPPKTSYLKRSSAFDKTKSTSITPIPTEKPLKVIKPSNPIDYRELHGTSINNSSLLLTSLNQSSISNTGYSRVIDFLNNYNVLEKFELEINESPIVRPTKNILLSKNDEKILEKKEDKEISYEDKDEYYIPENPDECIDFVLYTISARDIEKNEDQETLIAPNIRTSYTTVARAISFYNEKHPQIPIQPITLITFSDDDKRANVTDWYRDTESQNTLAKLVNMNFNYDPNPTIVYHTTHASFDEKNRKYILQSVAKLIKIMIERIPTRPPPEITTSEQLLDIFTNIKKSLFTLRTIDLVKYVHSHLFWFISIFFDI